VSSTSPRVSPFGETFGVVVEAGSPGLRSLDPGEVASLFKEHGAVLLRGFGAGVEDFLWLSDAMSSEFSTYRGGGLRWGPLDREAVGGNETLLTVTGGNRGFPILLHGEMYYLKKHPSILWFFCERAAERGGETVLCDGEALLGRLDASTRELFTEKSVKYLRQLSRDEWVVAFQTEDVDELGRLCEENGTRLSLRPDGSAETEYVCSAISRSRGRGRDCFVNNVAEIYSIEWAFESGWISENLPDLPRRTCPLVVRMEDGSKVPSAVFDELHGLGAELSVPVSWQDGDVLMVDNTRVMHGRNQTYGSRRKVLVRLSEPAFDW
jgi:alpha-ketoglutarate-dependent taurine dioxygenase